MREYLFVLLVAATVTYVTTPVVRTLAVRRGWVTAVRDRDVHAVPMPRLGGLAIFAGFVVALLVASHLPFLRTVTQDNSDLHAVLIGALLVVVLGVADDIWGLEAWTKFAGQLLAAGVMAFQGVQMLSLPVFGVTYLPTTVLVVITVLVVVTTMNAVNFVDGLDGLAAGITCIAAIGFFAYAYSISKDYSANVFSVASLIAAVLIGCCLGFLPFNFNPAKIFMGDTGAMLLGLLLSAATISLTGNIDPAALSAGDLPPELLYLFPLLMPIAVLVVPLLDLVLAIIRRTRAGRLPWQPDAQHLHHQMLALGHTHAGAVLSLYLWAATVAFGMAALALLPLIWALAVIAGLLLLAVAMTAAGPIHRRVSASRPAGV
ncbi:MraY family glycosyltransferase [Angustibacter sp. McL0619]|uniref:MraY family glycosyltransferase n=1 Tax=Angustibacter sp. McL0619 TaxID=3415676 RepID=UPI003CEBCE94